LFLGHAELLHNERKNIVRNTIAHASHGYNPIKDIADFKDLKAKEQGRNWQITCNLHEIFVMYQELFDCVTSIRFSFMIFVIGDVLTFIERLN
jgi:hypothetical protein